MWRHIADGAFCQYRGTTILYLNKLRLSMKKSNVLLICQELQEIEPQLVEVSQNSRRKR